MPTEAHIDSIGSELDAVAATLIVSPEPERKAKKETPAPPPPPLDPATAEEPAESDEDDLQAEADDSDVEDVAEDVEAGDDEDGEDDASDGPDDPLFTVPVNGKDTQVPLSELLRSYSGQRYIQQGMQQVAEARKALIPHVQALQQERAQLAQAIEFYTQALGSGPPPPDESLLDLDPIAYQRQEVRYRKHQEALAAHQETRQRALEANAREEAEHRQQVLVAAEHFLAERIPEFRDPVKGPELRRALVTTGTEFGFTTEELSSIDDPRMVLALNELRRLKAKEAKSKATITQKVEQARPMVVKPGAKRQPVDSNKADVQRARERMRSTGKVDDVAAFLMTPPKRRR